MQAKLIIFSKLQTNNLAYSCFKPLLTGNAQPMRKKLSIIKVCQIFWKHILNWFAKSFKITKQHNLNSHLNKFSWQLFILFWTAILKIVIYAFWTCLKRKISCWFTYTSIECLTCSQTKSQPNNFSSEFYWSSKIFSPSVKAKIIFLSYTTKHSSTFNNLHNVIFKRNTTRKE